MLKAWGRKNSINVQKVLWAVGELGLRAAPVGFFWRQCDYSLARAPEGNNANKAGRFIPAASPTFTFAKVSPSISTEPSTI